MISIMAALLPPWLLLGQAGPCDGFGVGDDGGGVVVGYMVGYHRPN